MMISPSELSICCSSKKFANPSFSEGKKNAPSTRNASAPDRTKDADARFPASIPMASRRMDLPAPVSPVKTVTPSVKLKYISSISAKFSMCNDCNMCIIPSLMK